MTTKPTTTNPDVYSRVTARIVADLEKGVRSWLKPWHAEHAAGAINRPLRANGTPYKGVNVLMLWSEASERGYISPIWMTYKQAEELGAHIKKGEHGALVVYADSITRTETDPKGEEVERQIPFMKGYTVFNVEQIDGLPAHYYAQPAPRLEPLQRIEAAEAFFAATGADIHHGGNRAFYAPGLDRIQMPPFETFKDAESYCATLAHELTHWTSHSSRLNRDFSSKGYGDEGYAREELVAEMGAAFLCADLGITPETRADHAAYIASWLNVLKNDKRFIFSAASYAQKAADYLLAFKDKSEQAEPEPVAA
ncbi:zincin-like metallopeptidase domain-containing protein [Accumulibacter sp.]|uniref:ArdC family protein n=1 Tax=Accumulibacter sp. TaxID=2053492 RepID=UPI00287AE8D4|nr:zincin-like metallopeptidase domain-containing protein [Accumulibacter sp.]MDS4055360.1 zincin-like metallopeptidase domain-containing protein [Accumulibacter sp.]